MKNKANNQAEITDFWEISQKNGNFAKNRPLEILFVVNFVYCKFTQALRRPPWPPELICSTLVQLLLTGKKLKGLKIFKNFQWILNINIMGFLKYQKIVKNGPDWFSEIDPVGVGMGRYDPPKSKYNP